MCRSEQKEERCLPTHFPQSRPCLFWMEGVGTPMRGGHSYNVEAEYQPTMTRPIQSPRSLRVNWKAWVDTERFACLESPG
jgi:hypothetical protein